MPQNADSQAGVSAALAEVRSGATGPAARDLPLVDQGPGRDSSARVGVLGSSASLGRRPAWLDLSSAQQEAWLAEAGQPKFRRKQIEKWIFQQRASSFAQMTDLPQTLRERLSHDYTIFTGTVIRHQVSQDGTEKLLIEYPPVGRHGPGRIECVLIREKLRRTICVSSQVGCGMGCVFCASGLDGVDRSLTVGEILEQLLRVTALLPAEERLSHIVMMGMGEPLANLANVIPALEVASSDLGLGISPRRITISTVGLPKAMEKLVDVGKRYQLAISLHAPTNELRNRIVPTNSQVGIEAILAAADLFKRETGRRARPPQPRRRWYRWLGRMAILSLIVGFSLVISWLPGYTKAVGFHLVPVAGTVLLDGVPLPSARVVFIPLERDFERALQEISVATTDDFGSFRLATLEGRSGAARGRHLVYVLPPLDTALFRAPPDEADGIDPWLELQGLLDWVRPEPLRHETNVPIMGTRGLKIKLERTAS